MARPGSAIIRVVILVLPLALLALWLSSGRGFHTQAGRVVTVQVKDELFGDTETQEQFVPGPVLGYYVGADVLILACVVVICATAVLAWRQRSHHRTDLATGRPV